MISVCTLFSALIICTDSLWLSCIFLEDELAVISVSSTLPNGPLGNYAIITSTYWFLYMIDECHLSALVKHVKEVNDWEILGIHLGVKDSVIKDIKALNHYQPAPSRKDMLVTWLKSGNANRANFIEALKAIGQLRIVQEIISQNGKNDFGIEIIMKTFSC